MYVSLLGQSFFVLSSDYKRVMLDEFYYLSKHVNMSYSDMMSMPTFERKYFINKLSEEFIKREEEYEKQKNKSR
jgi:hypothetical protein